MKKILVTFLFVFYSLAASAHPGKLDAQGGHFDVRTGYHYHINPGSSAIPQGLKAPDVFASTEITPNSLHFVRVVRVVGGDMIDVAFQNGAKPERVRLIGIDIPKTALPYIPAEYYAKEAFYFTATTLLSRDVWLQFDATPRDRHGHLLAYIWTERPYLDKLDNEEEVCWKMFNARLILGGYVQAATQPNSRYTKLFEEFQKEAREDKRGLWKDK